MSLSRLRSIREKRLSINKKDKPRLYSGDLYGNDEKPRKSTSSGPASVSAKATESSLLSVDDSNVVVHLLWNTQSLLASAWGMHSGLPPFFSPQVPRIANELQRFGIQVNDETIKRVLRGRYANGDSDKALDLLVMIEDSNDGIVARVKPQEETKLLGAENHGGVTCYLDTLLFAMFARLDAFEAILYNSFSEEDEKRRKLAARIRLFVNLLRSGKLVTTDIISQLQQSIAECGWEEASSAQQQDPSEAFAFITDTLQLPLLTVKVDIAHGGKEMAEDDHKFISERLLNLSLPPEEGDSNVLVPLEACLEGWTSSGSSINAPVAHKFTRVAYFNGRVDVKRQLERRRTIDSVHSCGESYEKLFEASFEQSFGDSKSKNIHVETTDLGSQPNSPIVAPQNPIIPQLQSGKFGSSVPSTERLRKQSLMRTVEIESEIKLDGGGRKRATTFRKEMLLPAWCFFSVLPFYTDSSPQPARSTFAEHFSTRRPVLGLCLKRYSWTPKKGAQRDPRRVDIPLEIALPTFVTDDEMGEDDGTLYGNFKLVLQSAICHRGNSVHSGHYVALIRGEEGRWLRFDDLALNERVSTVDHKKAFNEESPYMLFYQVQPLEDDETVVTHTAPPSVHSFEPTNEKRLSVISYASATSIEGAPPLLPPEPTINEPPSYENHHQTSIQFGASPPPYVSGDVFLSPPELGTEQNENMLRPSSRSKTRPGSSGSDYGEGCVTTDDGAKSSMIPRRSKSEATDKRSSWAPLRLANRARGKSQDKLCIRKSGEWKREEHQDANAQVSGDGGERDDIEKIGVKSKEKGGEKAPKEVKEVKEKEKKEKGKGKEKDKGKEKNKEKKEVRECIIQ